MGTLAGSNVLILTMPWALSVFLGRCDINAVTRKQQHKMYTRWTWFRTGVSVHLDVKTTARVMMVSILPYLVIQRLKSFSAVR